MTAVAGVLSVAQFCFAVDMALKPAWVKWWGWTLTDWLKFELHDCFSYYFYMSLLDKNRTIGNFLRIWSRNSAIADIRAMLIDSTWSCLPKCIRYETIKFTCTEKLTMCSAQHTYPQNTNIKKKLKQKSWHTVSPVQVHSRSPWGLRLAWST